MGSSREVSAPILDFPVKIIIISNSSKLIMACRMMMVAIYTNKFKIISILEFVFFSVTRQCSFIFLLLKKFFCCFNKKLKKKFFRRKRDHFIFVIRSALKILDTFN